MNNYKYIAINDTIQLLVATTAKMSTSTAMSNSNSNSNNYDGIYLKVLASILYSISMLLGVGGNALVLLIVLYYQRMHTVTNFFIVNLAISDLIFALLCIPITYITAYILQYWPFSSFLCIFFNYMQNVSVTIVVYTLIWITMDKYWAVVKPLKLRMSIAMCKCLILVSWLISFFISLPIAMFTKLEDAAQLQPMDAMNMNTSTMDQQQIDDDFVESRPQCFEQWPDGFDFSQIYNWLLFSVQYIIPCFILACSYIKIGLVLQQSKAPGEIIRKRDAKMVKSKKRVRIQGFFFILLKIKTSINFFVL